MAWLVRLNKKLQKCFGTGVFASVDRDRLVLRGTLPGWDAVVRAGFLAAKRNRTGGGVVNDIEPATGPRAPVRLPAVRDAALEGTRWDVLVVGAGVTGCAAARELARYNLKVLLVDKEHDVALHASSRNDGMVHPGIDLRKGSLKHKYNRAGNAMYPKLCEALGVPFARPGQYLCFSKWYMVPVLYLTLAYWKWMGIPARVVGKKALHAAEPGLEPTLTHALFFPTTGIVCPYGLTIALAENAVDNGVRLSLDTAVLGMETKKGAITAVYTNRGTVYPGVVVNAAGVFADDIAELADDRFYSIHPRRGTNSILDKKHKAAIAHANLASFGASSTRAGHTKGGGIVSTVHGNILVGPDAHETPEKENFASEPNGVVQVIAKHHATAPALAPGKIITYFTGVRAPTYEEDFVVCRGKSCPNLVHAAGIQSPGLTAAPAIGIEVARIAADIVAETRPVGKNTRFDPVRTPIVRVAGLPTGERDALIRQNPNYGEIVCRCEEVSRGEVLDALRRSVPCDTTDGVKRRVRPGMGRCQSGFCGPLVASIIAQEKGIPLEAVQKSGDGSALLCGPTKRPPQGEAAHG